MFMPLTTTCRKKKPKNNNLNLPLVFFQHLSNRPPFPIYARDPRPSHWPFVFFVNKEKAVCRPRKKASFVPLRHRRPVFCHWPWHPFS